MNQDKMGKFIAELRKEKNYSQEKLAELIPISRQAISKWEVGKSVPDSVTLVKLSEIFDVNVSEILAGERFKNKPSNYDNVALKLYDDRNKKHKLIRNLILLIFILVMTFLIYYFANTYNTIKIYTTDISTENVEISNGIFIATDEEFYFRLGDIKNFKERKILGLDLYYINKNKEKETLFFCTDCESLDISLVDLYGYNAYFDYKDINYILKNMKLKIIYEEETEIISLKFKRIFKNDRLLFNKKSQIGLETVNRQLSLNDKENIIKRIKSKYDEQEDGYVYKNDEYSITYVLNMITLKKYNKSFIEYMIFDLNSSNFTYEKVKDQKKIEYFFYNIDNDKCTTNDCTKYNEKSMEFLKKLNDSIK